MSRFPRGFSATLAHPTPLSFALLAGFLLTGPVPLAVAAITSDGNVVPLAFTWDNSTYGYVGDTASGTVTVDGNSGLLSSYCYIGYRSTGSGVVNVSGDGASWINHAMLYVGCSGSGVLSITNGGYVSCDYTYLGYNPGATGVVTVDGPRSKWTNSEGLYVGDSGSGSLSITRGGTVTNGSGCIGCNSGSTGTVSVDGVGSTWANTGSLNLGYYSGRGSLSITNGGAVSSCGSYLGSNFGSTGIVTVDGRGSTWTNTDSLFLGYDSGGGSLGITNGGCVFVKRKTYLGGATGSSASISFGNSGGTLTTGSLYFTSSASFTGTGTINTCGLVGDVDLVFDSSHGAKQTITLQQPGQDIAVKLDVTGGSGVLGDLGVGQSDAGAAFLTIRDGVKVQSDCGYIGYLNGSKGVATVTGSGSSWNNASSLYVGYAGSGTLSIGGGGSVSSGSCTLGSASTTGVVTVDGAGSRLTAASLNVAVDGGGTLSITNGGCVSIAGATIFSVNAGVTGILDFGAQGGTLTTQMLYASEISGTGTISTQGIVGDVDLLFDATNGMKQTSLIHRPGANVTLNLDLDSSLPLGIGSKNSGSLTIKDGVTLNSRVGYVGYRSGSAGVAIVAGSGSTWNANNGDLNVGYSGSGTLSITGGGSVTSGVGRIGYNPGSAGVVIVDGIGSQWTSSYGNTDNYPWFSVGSSGGGTLSISNGGSVISSNTDIAHAPGSTGLATVDGAGSTWTPAILTVANYGGTGTLSITNGGRVTTSAGAYIGSFPGTVGTVKVDGVGSNWSSGGGWFFVGGWTSGNGNATLSITNGGSVSSIYDVYIGASTGSTGMVTVSGSGSTWTVGGEIYQGGDPLHGGSFGGGSATLSITNGGRVSSSAGCIGSSSHAFGTATVDGVGSIWNAGTSLSVGYGSYGNTGTGLLSITNGGSVSSTNAAILPFSRVIVDGVGSTWTTHYAVPIGGTLSITNGGNVNCGAGTTTIGYYSGAPTTVTVDGAGSTWNCDALCISTSSKVALSITNGAGVSSSYAQVGISSGSTGTVRLDGSGSTWTNNGYLSCGTSSTLFITGGANLTTASITTSISSPLTIDVGRGSLLNIAGSSSSAGGICNLRVLAGAGVPADGIKYSPISAPTWSGRPTAHLYQGIGGTWDATDHTFTASSIVSGTSGLAVALNLMSIQRALVDDNSPGGTGWEVGASFVAGTSTTNITFTATVMDNTVLDILRDQLPTDESVTNGWTFATTNYTVSPTNPLYLSFKIGGGHSTGDFEVWHYVGTTWSKYDASDLTYDGTYASFTATGLSGYAMSAVPEPGTLALLAAGLFGLLAHACRKRK
jgi:fibronectin-binding autotransporter adhesin